MNDADGRAAGSEVAVLGIKNIPAKAGADRVVERLLEHFPSDLRVVVYVLAGTHGRDRRAVMERVGCELRFQPIPALPGKHLRAFSFFLLSSLHYLLFRPAPVAHIHNSDFGIFTLLVRLRARKVIGTFHGDPYLRSKWGVLAKLYLRVAERFFSDGCHVLTSVAATRTAGRGFLVTRPVEHIPNGIEARLRGGTDTGVVPEEIAKLGEGFILFACGRLDATKGLHTLLEAYLEVGGDRRLVAIGDFSHDRTYTREIEAMASRDVRVTLYKKLLEREDFLAVIRAAGVCVFPSEVEAMSMVLLEYIAEGGVVVCSDIPENLAVVGERYPYLFKSGDSGSLARVLDAVLSGMEEAQAIAARLRSRVQEEYDWGTVTKRYLALYRGR